MSIDQLKWRESSGGLWYFTVGKQAWDQLIPILALSGCRLGQHALQGLVKPFNKTVSLRMIWTGVNGVDVK